MRISRYATTHNIVMGPPLGEGGSQIWLPWHTNDECLIPVEPEDRANLPQEPHVTNVSYKFTEPISKMGSNAPVRCRS